MGYELHIERHGADGARLAIALSEWRKAVNDTEGLRLGRGSNEIVNPSTGEIISMANGGSDAEVYFKSEDEWRRMFYWSPSGRVSFRFTDDFDRRDSEIGAVARILAEKLGAVIVGDGGEIYQ